MPPWVDPQMQVILTRLRAGTAYDFRSAPIAEARATVDAATLPWSVGAPAMPTRELAIATAAGPMRARLYRPDGAPLSSVIVYVHGGGWTFGSIDTHDGTMRGLAAASGHSVLGIDYRLAPEHPFPAGLDDVMAALSFVAQGGLGPDTAGVATALAGDSAGANLALAALLRCRDNDRAPLVAALFYGCYEPDFSTKSHAAFGGGDYLLTSTNMRWYWDNFLGGEPDTTTGLAAPVRADLAGLPPLYLSAAGLDPLRDDTIRLAQRLAEAGVPFRFDHVPGVVHGCLRMSRELDAAADMLAAGGRYIADCLNDKKNRRKTTMERRTFIKLAGAGALAAPLARPAIAQGTTTVRWWYHFDNPQHSPAELVAKFEAANPGIKIQAESIPWGGGNDYQTRLFAALVAGNAPDCAMVRLSWAARFGLMKALAPLDDLIAAWPGRSDIADNIWAINKGADGKQYYVPLQYVVLYLYYRQDLFDQAGLKPPATFEQFRDVAKALTKGDVSGFGLRGGAGGFDHWGPFVLGGGANFTKGGMVSDKALAANRWFVDLTLKDKVTPASAATDSFRQIVDGFKAGRTAMTIHHVGSANEIVGVLGDKVSAVPVPRGPDGKGWTYFGDESNAVFASTKAREAAFKWCAFLSTAENNVVLNKFTGQLPIATSAAKDWTLHPKRFVDASAASLPIAASLPDSPKTPDFIARIWPANMQRALLGQIPPDEMMRAIEQHFHG